MPGVGSSETCLGFQYFQSLMIKASFWDLVFGSSHLCCRPKSLSGTTVTFSSPCVDYLRPLLVLNVGQTGVIYGPTNAQWTVLSSCCVGRRVIS